MDKIDETRAAAENAIIKCFSAGEASEEAYQTGDQAQFNEAGCTATEAHREAMRRIDAHALAVLLEYEDRGECNWSKYESLDGRRCVHYAEGRHPRHQGQPLAQCRLALIEQLEALVGPRSRK